MASGLHQPCEMCAVRALLGERTGLVVGITFVPLSALESMRWGHVAEPGSLLPAAVAAIALDFAFVPSSEPWAERAATGVLEAGAAPFWVVDGALATAVAVHGWSEAIRLTVADPAALAPALDEGAGAAVAETLRGLAAGAAGIVYAEDLAGAHGPLVAPDFVNEELLPRAELVVSEASRVELPSVFHSDGDARVFLPGIARAGFSAVHVGGMGEDMFVRTLRDARGHNLRVIGGIDGEALREGPRRRDACWRSGGAVRCAGRFARR